MCHIRDIIVSARCKYILPAPNSTHYPLPWNYERDSSPLPSTKPCHAVEYGYVVSHTRHVQYPARTGSGAHYGTRTHTGAGGLSPFLPSIFPTPFSSSCHLVVSSGIYVVSVTRHTYCLCQYRDITILCHIRELCQYRGIFLLPAPTQSGFSLRVPKSLRSQLLHH